MKSDYRMMMGQIEEKIPYLQEVFDVVKMDRSLLTGITCDEQAAVFYHSIVTVMQNMGYIIVAEGAETEEEVNLLREWGVDMVQGYYFSRPLPEAELLRLFML